MPPRLLIAFCTSFCLLSPATASEGGVGWRFDGSGRFPDCQPPTAWNLDSGEGVRWRSELPGAGKGSPLVWEQTVIVAVDHETVLGFDLVSGDERWREGTARRCRAAGTGGTVSCGRGGVEGARGQRAKGAAKGDTPPKPRQRIPKEDIPIG